MINQILSPTSTPIDLALILWSSLDFNTTKNIRIEIWAPKTVGKDHLIILISCIPTSNLSIFVPPSFVMHLGEPHWMVGVFKEKMLEPYICICSGIFKDGHIIPKLVH